MNAFSSTSRTIALVTSVVGGVALVGLVGSAAISTVNTFASGGSGTQTADATGVTTLDVESNSSDFTLRFGNVPEATLEVSGENRYRWDLRVDGDDLTVESRQRFGDFCLAWCGAGNEQVTLTLPRELDGRLDATIDLAAGRFDASGDFRNLDLGVGAGALFFDGSARTVSAAISAGRADLTIDGAREASFDVSAGRTDTTLTGDAPREVGFDVSAGRLDLTLPDETYDVRSDVSAGSLDNRLTTSPRSDHKVTASVSAGGARLSPSRG